MGFWLALVLVVVLIGALPTWPYSRKWGYGPAGGIGSIFLLILILVWFGVIAFTWPYG